MALEVGQGVGHALVGQGEFFAPVAGHEAFQFGLAGGGVSVGRNLGQPVSRSYPAPFEFTGGTITKVVVDVSGVPYVDRERELAVAFARD